MRLSANIIQSAEQRTNPLGEREILLRSLAIPSVEHLAVTRDQFDTIDLSNNHLSRLENFPKLSRLSCLYLGGNGIDHVDGKNLRRNCPGLKTVILTGNGAKGWNVVADLAVGCPGLEFLSLVGNPVTRRQHYRLYTIHKIPTLKVLDFQKVKQSERERASRLATSAAGAAMEADARLEARAAAATAASSSADDAALSNATMTNGDNGTNTFEPGEGKSAEESFATQFSAEEKAAIRDMVANAASAEEIDRIESLVKRGIFPGKSESVAPVNGGGGSIVPPPPPPPPPPLPKEEDGKRPVEGGGDEGGDTKRQKSE